MLLVLLSVTTTVRAADCRINGGAWKYVGDGGILNLEVPVNVSLGSDSTRILLEGAWLECRFTPSHAHPTRIDFWGTSAQAGNPWVPGPKFNNQGTGLRINGAFYNTPVPFNIRIATMPNNFVAYPIYVTPPEFIE